LDACSGREVTLYSSFLIPYSLFLIPIKKWLWNKDRGVTCHDRDASKDQIKHTKKMGPDILGIVMVIIAIVGAYVMIVYLRRFTNEERLAMIEKGVDPQFFNIKKAFNTSLPLRASLLMIGAGVGLLLGHLLI
jgi:hypothetical protein